MNDFQGKDPGRPLRSRREIVLGSLFLTAAGVTVARMPDRPLNYLGDNKLEKIVPETIGRWKFVSSSGLVLPTEDQLALTLYSQQLTRVYWDRVGPPIMLLIAAGHNQTGFLQVHRPEFCYTAGGYQLGEAQLKSIQLQDGRKIVVNKLLATLDGRSEWMLYWTRVGNHIPASWTQQRLAIAADNLQKIIPDAILIRASSIMPDGEEAERLLAEFVEAMIASIASPLQRAFTARRSTRPSRNRTKIVEDVDDGRTEDQHGEGRRSFIAEIIADRTADSADQIGNNRLVGIVVGGRRLAVNEQDDETGEYENRNPIINSFHLCPSLSLHRLGNMAWSWARCLTDVSGAL